MKTTHAHPAIEVHASAGQSLGMPPATFLRDYWQKHPLLIRNAFPDFHSSLSPEDLAGLACEDAALSRIVQQDRKKDRWTLRSGPFAEKEFPKLPKKDWTLLVQDVDKWDADVRALLDHFDFVPRWRVDDVMISFAAPGGSVGAHVDQYDVFLLQGLGKRHWQIDTDPNASHAFRDDVELKMLREFHPTHEWTLDAGDMLYLPPGVPHHGVAVDACLTYSVGMRAPSQSELLLGFAEHLAERMPESSRYSDADLAVARDATEIDASAIARVRSALSDLPVQSDAELAEWFGCFITTYRSTAIASPPHGPDVATALSTLAGGGRLLRHPFARMAWTRAGKSAFLFANGESYRMPMSAARTLAACNGLSASAYSELPEAARTAVSDLLERGIFQLQRSRKKKLGSDA